MSAQWLLVGGPADGTTVWVKAGKSVMWPGKDGEKYLYHGHDFIDGGKLYRVGCIDDKDLVSSRVVLLIHRTKVQHTKDRFDLLSGSV